MNANALFIYPPTQLMPSELPRFDGSLGPPYLAGALRREGIQAGIVDTSVGTLEDDLDTTFYRRVMQPNGLIRVGMSVERIKELIAKSRANIVGLSSIFTPQTNMVLEVAAAAKAVSRDILVVAGGVNARSLPERFLGSGNVDVICNTEGERVIVEIARAWEKGKSFDEISGTITMRDGKLVERDPEPGDVLTDLDGLPFPAWDLLPFAHYDNAKAAGRDSLESNIRSASTDTSRGCPFKCPFCHISREKMYPQKSGGIGKIRFKSVSRVVRELEILKSLGVKRILLEDDSLLADKPRMKEIFGLALDMGLLFADVNGVNLSHFLKRDEMGRLVYDLRTGKPALDEEYLEMLAFAGLTQIVFPVESGSQRILDKYATKKLNHKQLDAVELVKIAVSKGITCPINMMIGFPDETEEEIKETIELGRRLVLAGAKYCSIYIVIPFPGSLLFDMALAGGYLKSDFNTDKFNWRKPVMKNTLVSPARVAELQEEGWKSINPPEYVRKRLEMDIGKRWKSGEPETT